MRVPLAALILALSLQAAAVAAETPDNCAAREQALAAEAESACSGLSYLFNPSGCFIARKALEAFDIDACRAAAAPGQPVTGPPETTAAPVTPLPRSRPEQAPRGAAVPEPDAAQLKAENARLKAENARLKAELERLKAEHGADGGTR